MVWLKCEEGPVECLVAELWAVRLDWCLWRRGGLGSSVWQEDPNEEWEEDGVCPEGQEEASDESCVGVSD